MSPILEAALLPDARKLALERRVVLLEASNSVPLDISLGALPFEERLVERSSEFAVATGVALAGRLDEALIFRELEPLLALKGAPEAATRLREILRKAQ